MPAAAGQGAIPVGPAPVAAGQGAAITLQQANDMIDQLGTRAQMEEMLDQVRPRLEWYKTPTGEFTEEYIMGTFGPFARAKEWVAIQLDSDVSAARVEAEEAARRHAASGGRRRRKTRAKRKHFRKRTSRRH